MNKKSRTSTIDKKRRASGPPSAGIMRGASDSATWSSKPTQTRTSSSWSTTSRSSRTQEPKPMSGSSSPMSRTFSSSTSSSSSSNMVGGDPSTWSPTSRASSGASTMETGPITSTYSSGPVTTTYSSSTSSSSSTNPNGAYHSSSSVKINNGEPITTDMKKQDELALGGELINFGGRVKNITGSLLMKYKAYQEALDKANAEIVRLNSLLEEMGSLDDIKQERKMRKSFQAESERNLTRVKRLEGELALMTERARDAEGRLATLQQQLDVLRNQLTEKNSEIAGLKNQVAGLMQKVEDVERMRNKVSIKISNLQDRNAVLENAKRQLEIEMSTLRSTEKEMADKNREKDLLIKEYIQKITDLGAGVTTNRAEWMRQHETELERIRAKEAHSYELLIEKMRKEFTQEIADLKAEHRDALSLRDAGVSSRELDMTKRRVSESDNKYYLLNSKYKNAQAEIDRLKKEMSSIELMNDKRMKQFSRDMGRLEGEKKELVLAFKRKLQDLDAMWMDRVMFDDGIMKYWSILKTVGFEWDDKLEKPDTRKRTYFGASFDTPKPKRARTDMPTSAAKYRSSSSRSLMGSSSSQSPMEIAPSMTTSTTTSSSSSSTSMSNTRAARINNSKLFITSSLSDNIPCFIVSNISENQNMRLKGISIVNKSRPTYRFDFPAVVLGKRIRVLVGKDCKMNAPSYQEDCLYWEVDAFNTGETGQLMKQGELLDDCKMGVRVDADDSCCVQ